MSSKTSTGKDTIHVVLSDMHSGSNYALFLNRTWYGLDEQVHYPTSGQARIRKHFESYAEEIKKTRKGKKLRVIHNGDAIDGYHHASGDVCTTNILEQADIHIEIMEDFKKRVDWQRGDELYYTRGTKVHVEQMENHIAKELNAVPCGVFYVWDLLELDTNGVKSWFVHHGPGRGAGYNEGNLMRNWLRAIHQEAVKDESTIPSIVYTGHVHDPTYSTYVYRQKMEFFTMHGIILPSWQMKTSYTWMVAPVSKNQIGGVYQEVKADGTICMPKFSVMA